MNLGTITMATALLLFTNAFAVWQVPVADFGEPVRSVLVASDVFIQNKLGRKLPLEAARSVLVAKQNSLMIGARLPIFKSVGYRFAGGTKARPKDYGVFTDVEFLPTLVSYLRSIGRRSYDSRTFATRNISVRFSTLLRPRIPRSLADRDPAEKDREGLLPGEKKNSSCNPANSWSGLAFEQRRFTANLSGTCCVSCGTYQICGTTVTSSCGSCTVGGTGADNKDIPPSP